MPRLTSDARLLLAVNVGSSSLKCGLYRRGAAMEGVARQSFVSDESGRASALLTWLSAHADPAQLAAIGHRIVHGGDRYFEPTRIDETVRRDLDRLIPFAPNHLPQELALIDALARDVPSIPQIACFDTAFHRRMPEVARTLPIPARFRARGVQRYGFHGLSYAFLMEELSRLDGGAGRGRMILAHLGNGSSLAAVQDGISVDTTMAFTPMGGVVMSTRSGDLDPGVITYLARTEQMTADGVEKMLSEEAGLLALSGSTSDMQALLADERRDPAASLAVESYVYSVAKAIAALAVPLRGLDTLVFAGGIGEHAAAIRARICDRLAFLGVSLDGHANERQAPLISSHDSAVAVRVIPTNEELMIARATWRAIEAG